MENDNMLSQIRAAFGGGGVDIRTYSPLTFAYIGDAVYEIIMRTIVVDTGQRAVEELHRHTIKLVCAQTQAAMAEALYDDFMTEEEQAIYRRGKNAKINSPAKNASLADYKKATGLEAVCGYLFLGGRSERAIELVKKGIELLGIEI